MLSPVKASISPEFILAAQFVQDGAGQQTAPATKAEAALAILKLASDNQAGVKLAGLLGTTGIASDDILTNLALKFAQTMSLQPQQGESAKAFAARVADLILSMPALERVAAESKSGLMALGISASALASALKNPASPAAARLVALIETQLVSPKESALKTAISSYQATAGRDGAVNLGQPAGKPQIPANGPQTEPRNPMPNGRGVEVLRLLQGGRSGNEILGNVGSRLPAAPQANGSVNSAAVQVGGQPNQILASAGKAAPVASNELPVLPRAEVQSNRPALGDGAAFAAKENAFAAKAGSVTGVQTGIVAPQPAATLAAASAVDLSRSAGKSATVVDFTREVLARAQNQEQAMVAAQRIATAIAGRQALLFSGGAPSQEASEDLEKQISRALGNAARASQAAAAGAAAADQVLQQQQPAQPHVGVPFAQVPYPQQADEARKKAKGDEREGDEREDEDQAGAEGEEHAMQGEGDPDGESKRNAAYDIPVEDKPFEADEPLERHASDADRAYHMYQKYGGF